MKTNIRTKAGFTLVEIMIVVAIIGLLAAIAIPNFVRARTTAQKNACINNLRQIDGAKEQWALENKKKDGDTPTSAELFGASLYMRDSPTCPADGAAYTLQPVGTKQSCVNGPTLSHLLP